MSKYRKWISAVLIVMILAVTVLPNSGVVQADAATPEVVAGWTFSATNLDTATSGIASNINTAKLKLSSDRKATYSATGNTIYKDGWASGEYWEAQLSTSGYYDLTLSSKQYGTSTGPRDFKIQYSLNGTDFFDVSETYTLNSTIAQKDFDLPKAVENQPTVYIRWLNNSSAAVNNTGTTAPVNGNSRISDIVVKGSQQPLGPVSVTGVTLNTADLALSVGGKGTLTATVQPANATERSVTWSSSDATVATVDNGVVTGVNEGHATITVTTVDGSFRATAEVNVTAGPVKVTGITLDKTNVNLTVGATDQLLATIQPSTAANKQVAWTSSNAAVVTVDAQGKLKANAQGTAVITVTSQDGGFTATSSVNVTTAKTADPVASKITLSTLTNASGTAGAVAGSSSIKLFFADDTLAGTTTAAADGSFTLSFSNAASKTSFYIVAQENGKDPSNKIAVSFSGSNYKPGDVVFSQIYVGGGNGGAFYKTKFFELYNTTDQDINFNNLWAIGYTSATGTSFSAGTKLTGIIKAHGYYLVAGSTGATGKDLPVKEDQTTTINPSASTGGILAITNSTTSISSQDDPKAIDIVAFGNGTNPNFNMKTDHWGSPFFTTSISSGTLLRKTDLGSDPRGVFGLRNGYFTKNPLNDFVLNSPGSTTNPDEIVIRTSKSMVSPDVSKIRFVNASGTGSVTGTAGSVPGASSVSAYFLNNGTLTLAGQVTAGADGAFALNITNAGPNQTVYVTHKDSSQPTPKDSAYARVDVAGNPAAVLPITALRANDDKGFLLNLGYETTIEGIVTSANQALGAEKTSFYVQDSTGGIQVIGSQDSSFISPGAKVKVAGKLVFVAGATQLVATAITNEGMEAVPAATAVKLDAMSVYEKAEALEGNLISFRGKVTNIPSEGPDYNVTVADDAGNTAVVKIMKTTGIDINSALSLGDAYNFTGIASQSKLISPYTSGYFILPRNAADIKGDLQFNHVPLTKAYTGLDVSIKASAKYADLVTLYYKNEGESSYQSIPMETADKVNYNVKIDKANVKTSKIYYYIVAESAGQEPRKSGDEATPNAVEIVEDKDGPEYANELPANMDTIETNHPVVSVDLDDPNGVDISSLSISIDGKDFTAKAVKSETQIKLTLTSEDDLAVGVHTVVVSAKDKLGNLSSGKWSFEVIQRFTGGNHYRGTTHNHTNISHDAKGSPEDALKAAEFYGYDYFAFSDHSHDIDASLTGTDTVDHNGMPERKGGSDWQLTKDLANQYTKDGSFVVFPAFEMTSTTWGHSNVFGTTNFIDRVQNGGKYQNLQSYYAWTLTYDNIVAQFNHPAMSANAFDNFIPYDKNVNRLFTMLEVGNGSGNYSYVNAENKFFSALDLGWHVAPTYGEDNHDGTWGKTKKRTIIVANDLSQESLLEAMRKMRVYFSEDPNFSLDVLANGYYMGSTVDSKSLQFDIKGSDPVLESATDPKYSYIKTPSDDNIAKVELVTNGGRVIESYVPKDSSTSFSWNPSVNVVGGQQWFVVRVTQKDGDRTYSSPIWSQEDPLAVRVNDLSIVEGAAIAGNPVTLKAGISNMGTINLKNITAHFYYDSIDATHLIGDAEIPSLDSNQNVNTSVIWANPVAGNHKLIIVLSSSDGIDLGDNKYEQMVDVKAPLGITLMIDATHKNENTSTDTGTYAKNLTDMTLKLKQQGYTVVENTTSLSDQLLNNVGVLMVTHPGTEYSAGEIAVIKNFVDRGGSLLLTEKSNFGGTQQTVNSLLKGVGSSILVNNDGVFDETPAGNFWSTPLTSNFSVRLHLNPVNNGLTDFISLLDFYSGASLAANDGSGNKIPLANSSTVTVLASGNESTFQDAPQLKPDTVSYNVYTANGKNGPPLLDVKGGSKIPLVASEQLGKGRIFVAGMNIFNDKQMTQNDGPTNNAPFALKVVNWLANRETKVTPIAEVRKLPEETNVVIQGKVTTTAFYDSAFIQDETGGVVAFNDVPDGALQLGDTVRVYGKIGSFENEKELIFDRFDNSIVKVSSGPPVEPKLVSTSDSVSDAYQGQLVQVKGKVVDILDESTYILNDGSGPVTVFVDGYIVNKTGEVAPIKVGDTLLATGLSGKYSKGDRIRVRDTKELIVDKTNIPVTGVTVKPATLNLKVGESGQLEAVFEPATANNKAATWSTSNSEVATVGASGKVTAIAEGTATITVKTEDGGFQATSEVMVTPKDTPVTGVTLDKATLNLKVGESDELKATVTPDTASNKTVTWSTSNADVATVDASGKVTAIAEGTATIKVTTEDGKFEATSEVTVTPKDSSGEDTPVTGVTLDKATLKLKVGESDELKATVTPDTASNKAVTWSTSNADVATVDASGKVTAIAEGTATIKVTTEDGKFEATSEVTVSPKDSSGEDTPVTGVTLDKATLNLKAGESDELKATVTPDKASNKAVTWSTSNADVATVDASGKVTAIAEGTATIKVTTEDGKFEATSEVTVSPKDSSGEDTPVTGVTLDKATLNLKAGESDELKATVTPDKASNKAVTWSTSNAKVATVDASGKVTAIAEGTATIKVTTEDGKFEATSEVTVSPKDSSGENTPVTGVTLDKATLNLKAGESDELKATVTPDKASNKAVTWSTSNAGVATVDASGKVTAIAEGTATITATTEDGKFQATSEVTVTKSDTSGGGEGNNDNNSGGNPGTGSNGSGSNGSGGNTTPDNVVDNGSGASSSYKVSSESLNNSSNGVTTVEVPAKTTEISLPGNTADLIKQNALQIKSDAVTLTVPSELLKQLFSKLSTEEQQNSTITLKLSPLSDQTAGNIITGSSQTAHAGLKLSSDIYELTLSIQTASGQTVNLSKFDQPITIQLKVAADTNPKLAGIYYISDGGSIEYVGGTYANGYMTAKLTHFSKYAVLEYTKSFVDVPAGHWAADVIKELAAKQLVNGTSDSTFEPERKVTRAEFTAMLIRALHLTDKGTLAFTDVKDGDWYAEAVAIAVKAGIVQGKTQTLFDANAQITREEMVTMLMRGYEVVHGQVTVNNPTSFTDEAKISAWALPFVNAASANKLIQGRAAGKFDPKGITTRAEAAQVIYNLLNN
ncbi:DUF4350 domain-containing protein [Bacillus sp. FJAT-27264]|uniref:Ig-like domain-containing protein n=1 Tax=Paenibacillus sp. (strain DSM 101736 / FJAT-27264) TaxID=1850362 RepID=UPI000835BA0D|nr:DUF4350 domain-containing protein [Bacillus sp. FJAT-27264]